jgi:hypothetical protein
MSTSIPEVVNTSKITTCEFVEWIKYSYDTNTNSYQSTRYTFSSSYKDETFTVDGAPATFECLGGLLQVGTQQRDLKVTGFDTSIMLLGIDPAEIYRVVDRNTKGSKIRIWRGFYNDQYMLTDTYLRYTGIVTSYATNEDYQVLDNTTNLVLSCSATKYVLENLFSGRKTNDESWKILNPADTSMNNVVALAGVNFDFGKVGAAVAASTTAVTGGKGSKG